MAFRFWESWWGRIEGGGISRIAAAIIANKIGEDGEPWGRTSEAGYGSSILSSNENDN
jgi:hypothetical protein